MLDPEGNEICLCDSVSPVTRAFVAVAAAGRCARRGRGTGRVAADAGRRPDCDARAVAHHRAVPRRRRRRRRGRGGVRGPAARRRRRRPATRRRRRVREPRRARILAFGLCRARTGARVGGRVGARLAPLGYARDASEEFRPHLTLARFRVPTDLRPLRARSGRSRSARRGPSTRSCSSRASSVPAVRRHVPRARLPRGSGPSGSTGSEGRALCPSCAVPR